MKLGFIPLGDRVLVRPAQRPEQTESGLFVSEHRKPDTAGWIAAIGPAVHHNPCVKVGDYVVFSWQSGQEFLLADERFLIMREADLLAVVEEEEHGG